MKDDAHHSMSAPRFGEGAHIPYMARSAIAILAAYCPGGNDGGIETLEELFHAVLGHDDDAYQLVILRLKREGVPVCDIIDYIIPAVARILGDRWASDDITFSKVTIGTARLQDAVRDLAANHRICQGTSAYAPTILLIVPKTEEHTLGAFVLADQWRRMGVCVEMAVHKSNREIADILGRRVYAMVGITAAGRRTLASARELVEIVRRVGAQDTPVFLGGVILDRDIDVLAETGADHIAHTALSALRACGSDMTNWMAQTTEMAGQVGA